MEELVSLKRMLAMSWVYLALLTAGSWILGSWSFAWAVLAGGVISVGSFWIAQKDVIAFVDSLSVDQEQTNEKDIGKKSKKGFVLKFWLRIIVIGIVLLGLIRFGDINVFGLILGLTTVVFSVTFTAAGAAWRYYFSRR